MDIFLVNAMFIIHGVLTGTINALPISYWANTSSNSIIKSLIEKADDDVYFSPSFIMVKFIK